MLEKIYALRTPAPSELSLERTRAMALRWGCAVVAISLVPALAFAPALRVALGKERDPKLSAMILNVLQMCEG